jgi:hypothetical protein
MQFHLDHNEIQLQKEANGLRLTTQTGQSLLLANVTFKEAHSVITHNYQIVKAHFEPNLHGIISTTHHEAVSLKIVLHYFYLYQMWRSLYEEEKNNDLSFREKDFDHPGTIDTVIAHFKWAYPKQYAPYCQTYLGMTNHQFHEYEKSRQTYFDR